jgi:hypothetical protein
MINNKTFKNFIKENKKIEEYLYKNEYTFFFKYKKVIYAAKEEDRITFAEMKTNKEKLKYYDFPAYELKNITNENKKKKYFNKKNIKNIKVIQMEDAVKEIKNG